MSVETQVCGAKGYFIVSHDISPYTCAELFDSIGKKTPLVARFSTIAADPLSHDLDRESKGFSLKFYTQNGNWDIVGTNFPVFYIRDSYKFPEYLRAQKRNPKTQSKSPQVLWDFYTQAPESIHQLLMVMSSRGIPSSPAYMNGYGSHTYSFWNRKGERFWVKFHFKTAQGIHSLTTSEANKIKENGGFTYQRELKKHIENKPFPSWDFYIQVMEEMSALQAGFNPFDLTKTWPQSRFPLIPAGQIVLDENPTDYLKEIEQVAFSPSNVVQGIGHSPDRILQARIFSYADALRYRLGPTYEEMEVNKTHLGSQNDFLPEPPQRLDPMSSHFKNDPLDIYHQPIAFYNKLSPHEQMILSLNLAHSLPSLSSETTKKGLSLLMNIDDTLAHNTRQALKNRI